MTRYKQASNFFSTNDNGTPYTRNVVPVGLWEVTGSVMADKLSTKVCFVFSFDILKCYNC